MRSHAEERQDVVSAGIQRLHHHQEEEEVTAIASSSPPPHHDDLTSSAAASPSLLSSFPGTTPALESHADRETTTTSHEAVDDVVHKRIGDRHTFPCPSVGMPVPRVYWILPSGVLVNESSNSVLSHVQLTTSGSLRLFRVSGRDAGNYTCVAFNRLGEARHRTLLVLDMIDIHVMPLGTRSGSDAPAAGGGESRGTMGSNFLFMLHERRDEDGDAASSSHRLVSVAYRFMDISRTACSLLTAILILRRL